MQLIKDSTSKIIYLYITDELGQPKTGLAYNSAGAGAAYTRAGAATATISLVTQTASGAYSSGGFCEVNATNAKGIYRLDIPNAAIATGVDVVVVTAKFTGAVVQPIWIDLVTAPITVDGIWSVSLGTLTDTNLQSPMQAMRKLVNKTSVDSINNELVVYKENGSTKAYEQDATFSGSVITDLSTARTPT